jgi:1-acyl-sn-glycerol-3-phosphate acyltransferase
MTTWQGADRPVHPAISAAGWLRVAGRGLVVGLLVYSGLALLVLVRIPERLLHGLARPWTPHITQAVCRLSLALLGIRYAVVGRPMTRQGALVANHSSWLDIFALNACQQVYFVSKSEVEGWAGIGWLARATGTVFIARRRRQAKLQQRLFEDRLHAGHRLLFFPEGTSTDGRRVLPFKSTLFAAYFTQGLEREMHIQPATVIYHAPEGEDPRFYGWWGDMEFGPHLIQTLAARRQGRITVVLHDPVRVDAFSDRKALAAHCEGVIRQSLTEGLDLA